MISSLTARSDKRTIDLEPVYDEVLTVEQFSALSEKERQQIASVRIIAPRLNGRRGDFGAIRVRWLRPIYARRLADK